MGTCIGIRFRNQRFRIRHVLITCCLVAAASIACLLIVTPSRWGRSTLQKGQRLPDFDSIVAFSTNEIVASTDFADGCPYFAVGLTEPECRALPDQYGGKLHEPFVLETAEDPRGCFYFRGEYYYNQHEIGGNERTGRKIYCKHSNVSSRFQTITRGVCIDYGYLPINSQLICEAAAREMGLANPRVKITTLAGRPEGCYYFKNFLDGTATLWMSTNSQNEGKGEQESEVPGEFIRQPVCMAQTTTMPAHRPLGNTMSSAFETTMTTTDVNPKDEQSFEVVVTATKTTTTLTPLKTTTTDRQCKYVAGNGLANVCPSGAVSLNETECRSMPNRFGGKLHEPFIIKSDEDPTGCFLFLKWYYYNVHPDGKARYGRKLYCKHC